MLQYIKCSVCVFLAVYVCWTSLTVWSMRCLSSQLRAWWVKTLSAGHLIDPHWVKVKPSSGVIVTFVFVLCVFFRKQETATSSVGETCSLVSICWEYWTSWPSGNTPGRWWVMLHHCRAVSIYCSLEVYTLGAWWVNSTKMGKTCLWLLQNYWYWQQHLFNKRFE